jgi:hypothetical protein
MDPAVIQYIIPLGNLNPPGHTLPTSHIYMNDRITLGGTAPANAVFAPADGTVQFIHRNGAEAKIGVRSGGYTYHLAHVELDAGIGEGTALTAGQRIGRAGTTSVGIDFGVMNHGRTVFFANPARYSQEELRGDAPLRFFEEPLRSQLYAKVRRIGADRDGRFDYDQEGRLVGNWFLEGLPASQSSLPAGWPKHLAFVYNNYDPSNIRVSIGGTLPSVGAWAVQAGAIDPKDVRVSSGKVTYRLHAASPTSTSGPQVGVLIVQMLDAARIRVEQVASTTLTDLDFTAAARIYTR